MVGYYWGKNLFMPMSDLSDGQMRNIPYPRYELHAHVLYKTVEMGSIIGVLMVGPFMAWKKKQYLGVMISEYGRRGALAGCVAGPIMTETMLFAKKATPESISDRCYRLRYNRGQVRTDRYVTYTVPVIAGVGGYTGYLISAGIPIGVTVGCILAFAVGMINPDWHAKKKAGAESPKKN